MKTNRSSLMQWLRFIGASLGGALLYYLLAKFIKVPPLFGIRLPFAYLALVVTGVCFGPYAAFFAGFFGALFYALSGAGIWWNVILSAAFVGFCIGFFCRKYNILRGYFPKGLARSFFLANLFAHPIAIFVITTLPDMLIYKEAASGIFRRGIKSTIVNFLFVTICGLLLLHIISWVAKIFVPKKHNATPQSENWENILQ